MSRDAVREELLGLLERGDGDGARGRFHEAARDLDATCRSSRAGAGARPAAARRALRRATLASIFAASSTRRGVSRLARFTSARTRRCSRRGSSWPACWWARRAPTRRCRRCRRSGSCPGWRSGCRPPWRRSRPRTARRWRARSSWRRRGARGRRSLNFVTTKRGLARARGVLAVEDDAGLEQFLRRARGGAHEVDLRRSSPRPRW